MDKEYNWENLDAEIFKMVTGQFYANPFFMFLLLLQLGDLQVELPNFPYIYILIAKNSVYYLENIWMVIK